jgi:hypothetical protein
MEAFLETTKWEGNTPNHTYLLEGDRAIAYIKAGSNEQFYFSKPLTIDKRGRTFKKVDNPFTRVNPLGLTANEPALIEVKGSKGEMYYIDPIAKSCTCSGFKFRGKCKHTANL